MQIVANPSIAGRAMRLLLACGVLTALPAIAQNMQPDFPAFPPALEKQLAARASNVEEVTMDKKMLSFASQFLDSKHEDDQEGKRIVQKLNGIYVREYEFSTPDQYSPQDLQTLRKFFSGPEWDPMVRERSKKGGEDTDVYVKLVNGEIQGMFVLEAEPKELNLVYISGPIRPEDLKELSGNFGVPTIKTGKPAQGAAK